MSTAEHELVLELLRSRPELVAELLREGLGMELPHFAEVRVEETTFADLQAAEYRADLAVTMRDAGGRPVMAAVCEVQRAIDERKRFTWPLYQASLHARVECTTWLVVMTLDPAVAAWASRPIQTMPPGEIAPLVIGPDGIPWVRSADEARERPELAVLSARAHGNDPGGTEVVLAAVGALVNLSGEHVKLYFDWILSGLNEAARRALEAEMQTGKYEYQSDFAKRYVAQGRAEGKAEGRAEAVLKVLAARGLSVGEDVRARVLSCTDLHALDRWIARAATAADAAELFGDGDG